MHGLVHDFRFLMLNMPGLGHCCMALDLLTSESEVSVPELNCQAHNEG